MKENTTLYLSDLDGTLLNQNAELSRHTKDSLNRMIAQGLCFSVATARSAASALHILDGVQWRVPLVLLNGVLVYDAAQKQYVQVLALPAPAVTGMIAAMQSLNATGIMYQMKNGEQVAYYETLEHKPLRDFAEERKARYHKTFEQACFANVAPEQIIYFTLLDAEDKIRLAHAAFSAIPGICLSMYEDIYKPGLWYLEIHSDRATKENGAKYLREAYGFERVVGFGDNLNDLPLFNACDTRVAVENAKAEVKAAADFICGTNTGDGVVKWLEAHIAAEAGG